MRYKGPATNWWPIVLLVVIIIVLVAVIYYFFFLANPPAGPTEPPGMTQSPIATPTGSP